MWLTTNPFDEYPISILQRSIKVAYESPEGLRANINMLYQQLDNSEINQSPKKEFKRLIYALAFFHSALQERKKYGRIGWNRSYGFNHHDFTISLNLVDHYLTKAHDLSTVSWDGLEYLIGEVIYGGQVTDQYDGKLVRVYLNKYFGNHIFNKDFCLAADFKIPQDESSLAEIHSFIDKMPLLTVPEVIGLHNNAEITYNINNAKVLRHSLLSMQSSSDLSEDFDRDAMVLKI